MRPAFSEFSFGYAFLHLFQQQFSYCRAPFFPTQNQEAKLGYDVKLLISSAAMPVFIQLKRSDYLFGHKAKLRKQFGHEYYAFHLRGEPNFQHQNLYLLNCFYRHVYYVAPMFHQFLALDYYFHGNPWRELTTNTFMIMPREISGIRIDEEHTLGYDLAGSVWVKSEPKEIKPEFGSFGFETYFSRENLEDNLFNMQDIDNNTFLKSTLLHRDLTFLLKDENLNDPVGRLKVIREIMRIQLEWQRIKPINSNRDNRIEALIEEISIISRLYYGAEFLLVSRKNESEI